MTGPTFYETMRQYIHSILEEHTDPLTGEVCLTKVEEDVMDNFGLDLEDQDAVSWQVWTVYDAQKGQQ